MIWLMIIFLEMHLETMNIFSYINTISALVLIDRGVAFQMTIEHRLVDTFIITIVTLKRFVPQMIALMVFKMMLVFSHKFA